MSGHANPNTHTTLSVTLRPLRVKWYASRWAESTNGGSRIGFSGSSETEMNMFSIVI